MVDMTHLTLNSGTKQAAAVATTARHSCAPTHAETISATRQNRHTKKGHLQILCRGLRRGGLEVRGPLAHSLVHVGRADPGQGSRPVQPGARQALRQQIAQSVELATLAVCAQQRERLLPSVQRPGLDQACDGIGSRLSTKSVKTPSC